MDRQSLDNFELRLRKPRSEFGNQRHCQHAPQSGRESDGYLPNGRAPDFLRPLRARYLVKDATGMREKELPRFALSDAARCGLEASAADPSQAAGHSDSAPAGASKETRLPGRSCQGPQPAQSIRVVSDSCPWPAMIILRWVKARAKSNAGPQPVEKMGRFVHSATAGRIRKLYIC